MAFLARAVLPARVLTAMALLALALGVALLGSPSRDGSASLPAARDAVSAHSELWRVPASARGAVSGAIGAALPAYRVATAGAGTLYGANPAQRLTARFAAAGTTIASGSVHVTLRLTSAGFGAALHTIAAVAPSVRANRVSYRHPGLREWYANGPLGLEQGFTVSRAPRSQTSGPLTLSLAVSGAVPRLVGGGRTVEFGHGRAALRYSQLSAVDAHGRPLHGHISLRAGHVLLRLETGGARFPVHIDPLVQQGEKMGASDEPAEVEIGTSVALSANGNTLLVTGIEGKGAQTGGAWVFTRVGSTWTQQGPRINGSDEGLDPQFGQSAALSADGNTALIGGYTDSGNEGAAWVFTRTGGTWAQQGPKLTSAKDGTLMDRFGRSVALSSDGNTALIGAYADGGEKGAAFVFTRSGATWSQQGPKLTGGTEEEGSGRFGTSVALASDGATALIGSYQDETAKVMAGAAWVFVRGAGGTWTQQGEKLTGSGGEGTSELGAAVALSSDGNTALAGAPGDGSAGAAWVFARAGSKWIQQGAKLAPNDASGASGFGAGVALSSDGNTALIGGPVDMGAKVPEGAAWEFTRAGSAWTQAAKLKGGGQTGEGEFGVAVALSSDGDTAAVGAPLDNLDAGAFWTYLDPPPPVTTGSASAVSFTTAQMNGLVGAGASNTTYFEYGSSAAYGSSTIAVSLGRSGVARALATGLSGLPLGTTIHYRLVAENSAGRSLGADQSFITGFPIGKEAPPLPPIIEGLSQSHAVWRVGRHAATLARRRAPLGTTFSVKLSETASLSLTFTQRLAGRRVGRRCLTPGSHNRHRRACKRTLIRGLLSLPAHAGVNKVLFQGVIAHNHTLKPGTYIVQVSARSARGLLSETRLLSFRITR